MLKNNAGIMYAGLLAIISFQLFYSLSVVSLFKIPPANPLGCSSFSVAHVQVIPTF